MPTLQKELRDTEGQLAAVNKKLFDLNQQATVKQDGEDLVDLSRVKVYGEGRTNAEILDQLRSDKKKSDALGAEVERIKGAISDINAMKAPAREVKHPQPGADPDNGDKGGGGYGESKSVGQLVTQSDVFGGWQKQAKQGSKVKQGVIVIPHLMASEFAKGAKLETKTTFSTSAGWAPESLRTGKLVLDAQRPVEVMDAFPMGTTSEAAIVYMEETTFTNAAAERNEAAAYAEATLALTEQSQTVRSFGVSLPVTDEQLADVAGVESFLDQRLRFMVRQKLDSQLLNGDGNAPNIEGILNVSNIQTQAKGADPVLDAFYKAMDLVAVTGRAEPNVIMIHRTDFQPVRLLRTTEGMYIYGNPSEAGPSRMWGLPLVVMTLSQNTGLVGDFANFCMFFERRGLTVEIAYDSDDFTKGMQTIRAGLRGALVTYRPEAFCTVTGI